MIWTLAMDKNSLPKHWQIKTLGEVCEITMGQSPKGENVFENNLNLNGLEFHQGKICFTDKFIEKSSFITTDIKKTAKENSILLCVRAPVGIVNITPREIAIGRGLCALNGINIENMFLFYFLKTNQKYFIENSTGSTFQSINSNTIKSVKIPLPSVAEQREIVSEIERRFEKLDKAIENFRQILKNLKLYRQSVLKFAFDGKFTNPNLTNWQTKPLGEVCEVTDGTHESPKYVEKGYPLITSKNLKNGLINFEKIKYINQEDFDSINIRSKVSIGDILFAMIGTIGNPVVITTEPNFAIKNVALIRKSQYFIPNFIKFFLESDNAKILLKIDAKGSTQKFVPLEYLRNFQIPLPPLSEQKQIVSEIEKRFAKADKIENLINKSLKNAEILKQSILKQAFSGNLKVKK